jgi:hypothetical protein
VKRGLMRLWLSSLVGSTVQIFEVHDKPIRSP